TGPESAEVPEFSRMTLDEYTEAVNALGLSVGVVTREDSPTEAADIVLGVSPEPGTRLDSGATIEVTVSSGKVSIPDVMNQPLEVARNFLEGLGLDATYTAVSSCPQQPGFPVSAQSIVGQQPQRSKIEISYCSG